MTRPGDRLRCTAARFCSRSAMERLIDPAVADLQAEYRVAEQAGSVWTRVWTLLRGYAACLKVITLCACPRSTVVNLGSRTLVVARTGISWLSIALLVLLALLGPRAVPAAQVALWYVVGGPPLDFDAPHNGQVIAHIDLLGRIAPDVSRIRITNTADSTVVWDVKPLSNRSECWNNCWNLKFQVGPNQSSFSAGHQAFAAQVPQAPTFSLAHGTLYLFEVWDGKGRLRSERFRL
jgi:hypothetical protein